jgi:hypothetical protein
MSDVLVLYSILHDGGSVLQHRKIRADKLANLSTRQGIYLYKPVRISSLYSLYLLTAVNRANL